MNLVYYTYNRKCEVVPERLVADGGCGHPPGRERWQTAVRARTHAHHAHRYLIKNFNLKKKSCT
jgi:hypothetical protein